MKCLIVYYLDGKWYGEEVAWRRSGSGTYREVSRIDVPQSREEIEQFAHENRYVIEWRGELPIASKSAREQLRAGRRSNGRTGRRRPG